MGVDLRLLPVDGCIGRFEFSHIVLSLWPDKALFDGIREIPIPVTARDALRGDWFDSFLAKVTDGPKKGCSIYGPTSTDGNGNKLHFVERQSLIDVMATHSLTPQNRAALAWLREATHVKWVALYWC